MTANPQIIILGICDPVNKFWSAITGHPLGAFYEREFEPLFLPEALIESG
jgi:hypothetical protein